MKTPAYLNVVWNTEDDYKLAILNQILALQDDIGALQIQ